MPERIAVLLPLSAQERIKTGGRHGELGLRMSDVDALVAVGSVSIGKVSAPETFPTPLTPKNHRLNLQHVNGGTGWWERANADLHLQHLHARLRNIALKAGPVRQQLPDLPALGPEPAILITYAPDIPDEDGWQLVSEFAAWMFNDEQLQPIDLLTEPAHIGIVQLTGHWPVAELQARTIALVGTGSIGSAAAHALASYGLGRLLLIDPDRLARHNLIRHTSSAVHVGRHKVDALAEELREHRPDTEIHPHRLDVVADADQVRPLLDDADLVLCCADGVAARRVSNHLARRAGLTTVLGCVLDTGRIGEVLRLRPWPDQGCLTCQRSAQVRDGVFDAEPTLDRPYGEGFTHLAMTAVGGDLHLVGGLAAKVSVATILQAAGDNAAVLPGDLAVIALQPNTLLAAPYGGDGATDENWRAGGITWTAAAPPESGCPTCDPNGP